MESGSSHQNGNNGPDTGECCSSPEARQSLKDSETHNTPDFQLSSFMESLQSSSQETFTLDTSSELPSFSDNSSSIINSSSESSLAHPLSSSELCTGKSGSSLDILQEDFDRDTSGSEDSCEAELELQKAQKSFKADICKVAKLDILKAMKADFCKPAEVEGPEQAKIGVSEVECKRKQGEEADNNKVVTEENAAKDYYETESKVHEEPVINGNEDGKAEKTVEREETARGVEVVEGSKVITSMEQNAKDNNGIVSEDKGVEVKDSEQTEVAVNGEIEKSDITELTEVTVNGKTEKSATYAIHLENKQAVEDEVSSTTADMVLVNQADHGESSNEAVASEPLQTARGPVEKVSANNLPADKINFEGSKEMNEEVKTNELRVSKEKPVESSVVSDAAEAETSNGVFRKEKSMEFSCSEDSGNDTLLDEEAERLDKLDLCTKVTLEPKVENKEEHREQQYKKLVDLLSKSKFYTDVLLKKVEADVGKYPRKRKHCDDNCDTREEGISIVESSESKRKKILIENQRAMYQVASKVMKNEKVKKSEGGDAMEIESTEEVKSAEQIQQPKLLSGGTLRDYQLQGFNWLKVLYENGVNGILADEMGLGKTIQVIALLCHLVEMKVKGPYLIVGPLSTLPNWMVELKRFAPQLHVTLFHGSKTEREKICRTLMKRKNVNGVSCFPIVVTSYEIPVFEREFMETIGWKYIIVDEGHRIKNYNTVLAKVLRTFDSANRLLLTGTPLHNSLSELWALLNFLVPEIFDNLDVFESWFRIEELTDDEGRKKIIEEERRKSVLGTLHQILAPFMLRRVKSEVCLDIPKKKEVVVHAPMTDMQFKLYQAVLEKKIGVLQKTGSSDDLIIPDVNGKRPRRSCTVGKNYEEKGESDICSNSNDGGAVIKNDDINAIVTHYIRVKMQNPHMALKQIASHPYLIHYPLQEDGQTYKIDDAVIKSSGKFLVLDAMLEKLYARGHKVLIFSTLCTLLDVLEDYLSMRTYSYERLDGSVKIADRTDSIHRFNTDPNIFLFLLSTRAGGLGVNLTAADTVIFIDSDWNPQVDLQAQDRCHRIGQTRPVMVYRLVTTGTMEEQLLQRASAKRVLEKMVICKGTSTEKDLDLEELKTILESRDYSDIVYTDGQEPLRGDTRAGEAPCASLRSAVAKPASAYFSSARNVPPRSKRQLAW